MPMPGEFATWGYLITEDKKAKPLLKSLYKAIVNHIVNDIQPKQIRYLTPEKLAAFYREVGGNLDDLFLKTDPLAISEVYTTLGCVHSLLPDPEDDYSPPRIPALHPRGFERWQTIQLLMEPEEHAPYLQEAVRKFALIDPQTGLGFQEYGELPREAFPLEPDEATREWHENVFLKRIKDNEERAAEAGEKVRNVKSEATIPGGGTSPSVEEEGIRLDDDAEDNETMKGEGLRTPYSTRSGSPSRHRPHSRASTDSYYDARGRSRSPMPPHKGVDPDRLHTQRHSYTGGYRYATPEPPSDMDDHRGKSRKNSHIHYVYEGGESRPIDDASVRSVSPSLYGGATATSHHPSIRRRRVSNEQGSRGRSADTLYSSYYTYGGGGYRGHSRSDSHSPIPKSRSKSHGGPSVSSSTESLHQAYRPYLNPAQLPPMSSYVYQQEISLSRLGHTRSGHLRTMDTVPIAAAASAAAVDYYQIHTPPHHVTSSSSSATVHPLPAGVRSGGASHHQRAHSPRRRSGRSAAHSGSSSRYQSSTDSLLPPDVPLPPVPPLSGTTVPTTTNVPPPKRYPTVMSDSEDEYNQYHHHQHYASVPSPSHHRSGSGGTSTIAQAGVYKGALRRDRERDRDRRIESDRMLKMQQMGGGSGLGLNAYDEEVAVGGRRGEFRRPTAGGKAAVSSGGSGRMGYSSGGVSNNGVTAGGYSTYLK